MGRIFLIIHLETWLMAFLICTEVYLSEKYSLVPPEWLKSHLGFHVGFLLYKPM